MNNRAYIYLIEKKKHTKQNKSLKTPIDIGLYKPCWNAAQPIKFKNQNCLIVNGCILCSITTAISIFSSSDDVIMAVKTVLTSSKKLVIIFTDTFASNKTLWFSSKCFKLSRAIREVITIWPISNFLFLFSQISLRLMHLLLLYHSTSCWLFQPNVLRPDNLHLLLADELHSWRSAAGNLSVKNEDDFKVHVIYSSRFLDHLVLEEQSDFRAWAGIRGFNNIFINQSVFSLI